MNSKTIEQELLNNGISEKHSKDAAARIRSAVIDYPENHAAPYTMTEDSEFYTNSFDPDEIERVGRILHSTIHQYLSGWIK